ncbi:MAG: histidine--tRNA ligase [Pseudomonadota bacterium]|nr:histidine--tRNA ligase [Pseudomonadota bacterium]
MKAKQKKPNRPKAINPKGFKDYSEREVNERTEMLRKITEIYFAYGFEALETPAVETVEALGSFLPDVDRPNAGVFSWLDEGEKWLALRYDLTAPLARFYAQNRHRLANPYRRFAMGPVWRNEKPGPGRYKQFYQCDADTVGAVSPAADAEICIMLSDILDNIGVGSGNYQIKLNNRKILNGILEKIGLLGEENGAEILEKRGIVLRTIDKLDRLGISGVTELLGRGREDESGDFSAGANLTPMQVSVITEFLTSLQSTTAKTCAKLRESVGSSEVGMEGLTELERIYELCIAGGVNESCISVDPGIVRGLGYYTGTVFEADLSYHKSKASVYKSQFGSVAGGGRYDNLVKRFIGQLIPATGVSLGVDRLLAAVQEFNEEPTYSDGPVVVTVMDKSLITYYQQIVQELRKNQIRSEMFLGNAKELGKQLKYADQRKSPIAIIVGSDELEKGVVQLKDLHLGAKLSRSIKSNEEWKSRPSQIEIKRNELIEEVQKMLNRVEKKS